MLGKAILLSMILACASASTHMSRFFEPVLPKDLDTENMQLNAIAKDNCGGLKDKALQQLKENDKFANVREEFTSAKFVDCRALAKMDTIWVRLTTYTQQQVCKAFVPLNTIALFHDQKSNFPHLYDKFAEATIKYNKCVDRPARLPKSASFEEVGEMFSEAEKEVLAAGYLNNVATVEDVPKMGLDQEDTEKVVAYLMDNKEPVVSVDKIDGLSQQGKEAIKEHTLEVVPEEKLREVLNQVETKIDLASIKEEKPEPVKHSQPVDENKKYLAPSQISETATYCKDFQVQRAVDLYKAMATLREVRPYVIYTQSVTECIVGHDGKRLKAVMSFSDKMCLFNLFIDENNKPNMLYSEAIDLEGCHKKVDQSIM